MHGANTMMPALAGLLAFIVLFAAAVMLLRWLQKRLGTSGGLGTGPGDIRIVRRFPLGWQCVLLVVEIGERQYVLTTSRTGGVTLVDKLDEPLTRTSGEGAFHERLKRALRKQEG
jgi:flagellar biogenesis protein FliO